MSKPLTLGNREDKGDIDGGFGAGVVYTLKARFPSYFDDFCLFSQFLASQTLALSKELRFAREHEIPSAAAIMAIV
jgi:hypothetical protein